MNKYRRGRHSILVVLCFFCGITPLLLGSAGETWILYPSTVPLFGAISKTLLESHLERPILCPLEKVSKNFLEDHPPNLIIALGESGVRSALALDWDVPIIAAFVDSAPIDPRIRFFNLHLPHVRQLEIVRRLSGSISRIFFPYASENKAPCGPLVDFVHGNDLELHAEQLSDSHRLPEFFRKISVPESVVLLPADSRLMNSAFLDGLFQTSFQQKVMVIGFSEKLVQQGALFALALSPEGVAKEIEKYGIDLLLKGGKPANRTRTFEGWDLYLNSIVARKMGFSFPPDLVKSARRVF